MSDLDTESGGDRGERGDRDHDGGGGSVRNTISGSPVFHGGVTMAQVIRQTCIPPRPPLPPPSQIPSADDVFVNRADELAELDAALASHESGGTPRVVLVTGLGGVGKTHLVTRWADRTLKTRFPDGQLYVDLEDMRRDGAVDVADVLDRFFRALDVHEDCIPVGLGPRRDLYRTVTADRELLVFVDNARQAPEVRLLVPSHGMLVATSHTRLTSLLMDGAKPITVDPLDDEAGVQLIRRWPLTAGEDPARQLVRICGGLPLALRAATEWLVNRPHLRLEDVVLDLTPHWLAHPVDGRKAVGTVLDAVVAEFPEHSARLYDVLGVLPCTTVTAAVAAAAGAERVDDALADLFTAHLAVPVTTEGGPPRFRLHDAVRKHAAARARDLPVEFRRDVLRGVADFYVAAAAHADALVLGPRLRLQEPPQPPLIELSAHAPLFTTAAEALDWFDAERANLLTLLRAAFDAGRYDSVWRLCESLWAFYHSRKHHTDSVAAHDLGVRAARQAGRPDAEVRMHNQLARARYALGALDEAERQLAGAAPLLAAVAEPRLRGVVRETRGLIALAQGRPEDAYDLFTEAHRDNAEKNDRHGMIVQSYNIGQALLAAGRAPEALEVLDRAMSDVVETGDGAMGVRIEIVRARALGGTGDLERATQAARHAVEGAAERKQYAKLDQALELLVDLASRTGDTPLREACDERLRALRRTVGVAPPEA